MPYPLQPRTKSPPPWTTQRAKANPALINPHAKLFSAAYIPRASKGGRRMTIAVKSDDKGFELKITVEANMLVAVAAIIRALGLSG